MFPDKGFYEGIVYSEGGVGGPTFSSAQHAGSLGPARLMARRVDLAGATKFLDVGGGSGAYTLAFLKQNPKLRATILDFPETIQTAQRYASEAGVSDRVTHVEGNAITTAWPGERDVVLMSYVWSAVGGNDIPTLARRAFDGTAAGWTSANPRLHGRRPATRARTLPPGTCSRHCSTIRRPNA